MGPGNGARQREAPPEPRHAQEAPPEPERIRLGDPLDPNWAEGIRGRPEHEPPPRREPRPETREAGHQCVEWCPICRTADVVRAGVPPEVRSQLENVQRDALVAMRTVLDHYIDRLDGNDRPASRVEDIPIN